MNLLLASLSSGSSESFINDQQALLPSLILVPLLTAIAVVLLPRKRDDLTRGVALLGSAVTGMLAIYTLAKFQTGAADYQFVVRRDWIASAGVSWHFGVDGISLFMVVLTGLLFPLALAAVKPDHNPKPYYAWMMLLMAGSMGAFVALDLILFFACFEIVLIPMYFLIGIWGHGNRKYVAMKFFLFTMFGSALMLVGIFALAYLNYRSTGRLTFDLIELGESQSLSIGAGRWVFASFALAFAVKVPLFPVHTWLPDAHTEAPTAGSVILAGVMLKLGAYGLLRFGFFLFPEATRFFGPTMLTLAVIGIIYGAVVATMQTDLKGVVAYSSVAHMGFIILGIYSLTVVGVSGGVLQMLNHGVTTPALFLIVGFIYERRHTREISALSGLAKPAPVLAGLFTVTMLASIGVPGLNGFVGEYLELVGTWSTHRWWAVVAAAGVILAALYLLWAYQRVMHGPAEGANSSFADLRTNERMVLAPFVVAMVGLGLFPQPALERIEPSVRSLLEHVEQSTGEPIVAATADVEPVEAETTGESTGEPAAEEDSHSTEEESGS